MRSVLWRRSLASKLKPPVVNPPPFRISYSGRARSSTEFGNWSVSQPFWGSPRLASIEPEDPVGDGVRDLVVEGVAGQRRVVRLDVQPVLALEAVPDEEAVDRRGVVVVLVLGRLHRLRLDQQRALEPDAVLVLGDEVEEPGELVALAPEVGVEERVVALAAAPQDVVRAAEPLRDLEHVLDLGRGVGEHLGIRVRRRAALVARVGEQVGGAPEELGAGPLLVAERVVGQGVEVVAELGERGALGRDVAVVEAVVRDAELLDELERDGHLLAGGRHRVGVRVEPGPVERPDPEHVATVPRERVPQAHADPEVVLHPLAEDQPVRLVDLEREGVGRVEAAERDRARHLGEEVVAHVRPSVRVASRRGLYESSPKSHPGFATPRAWPPASDADREVSLVHQMNLCDH